MKDFLNFHGKTAIITGGRRGLGRAMALELAARGAKVAVIAKNKDGSSILKELSETGTPGLYYSCDVAEPEQRNGLISKVVNALGGRLDILINNAGIQF